MRIISLVLGIGFVLAFLSIGISSNKVIGQVTSSSGGSTISLNNNFTGNWKAKIERIKPSSSSGLTGICETVDCAAPPEGCTYINPEVEGECAITCGELSCSSSSSGGLSITLEAITKNHGSENHGKPKDNKSSKTISLKLCVDNGQLKGTIHQGGVLNKANIISQEIISENSVSVDLQDKKGITKKATLELIDKNLKITFDDGVIANGRKLNKQGCISPKVKPSPSSSGSHDDEHEDDNHHT